MKIIIPGGSGQVGQILAKRFLSVGHDVVILSRGAKNIVGRNLQWDGRTRGDWFQEINGADVVINMAGRTVNCRYHARNRAEIINSRVDSTRIIGEAIRNAAQPPKVWLQASTATIYDHSLDRENDEFNGVIGDHHDAPDTWTFSLGVATSWEKACNDIETPQTRKVLLRSAITLSPDRDGVFDVLMGMVRKRLGGRNGDGRQYVSWIHDEDFGAAIDWLMTHEHFSGPVNLSSPNPLPNRDFMRELRRAAGVGWGLPASRWMIEIGAFFMRTESELLLKSRRVTPKLLLDSGFKFRFPEWSAAAVDLVSRWRQLR